MEKRYCYFNFKASDAGDVIISYEERIKSGSNGGEYEHVEYRSEDRVKVFSATDLATDEGLKNLGAFIKELSSAKL